MVYAIGLGCFDTMYYSCDMPVVVDDIGDTVLVAHCRPLGDDVAAYGRMPLFLLCRNQRTSQFANISVSIYMFPYPGFVDLCYPFAFREAYVRTGVI